MEDKIGYAVITTNEYKYLIEENNKKDEIMSELREINKKKQEKYEIYENLFLKQLIENEEYHLTNMKNIDVTDYHYQQLFNEFLKIRITDVEYIDLKIKEIRSKLEASQKKGDDIDV